MSGVQPSHVYAVSIDRDSAGKKGPVIRRLSGEGAANAKGVLTLRESERRELLAGNMALVVYTADAPAAAIKAAMVVPR